MCACVCVMVCMHVTYMCMQGSLALAMEANNNDIHYEVPAEWSNHPSGVSAAWLKFSASIMVTQCPLVGWHADTSYGVAGQSQV